MKKEFKSVVMECAMLEIESASDFREWPEKWVHFMERVKRWKRFYLTGDFEEGSV